MANEITTKFQ